ncbi:hypothetical protein BH09PSE2_BH09PSE2_22960 [soil metagenome]
MPFAPSSAPVSLDAPQRRDRSAIELARMVESEIIPRLMLAHRDLVAPEELGVAGPGVSAETLESFLRASLQSEAGKLVAFVKGLMENGLSLSQAYSDLLIPTARRLGEFWEEDAVSFTDVTIGLSRLQQVVRAFGREMPPHDLEDGARAAYFIPCPYEQHTFGLTLLEDSFRRVGWRTWLDASATQDQAADAVHSDWFDVFGLSATSEASSELIASTIASVRKASRNPNIFVLVGGGLFTGQPDLVAEVGADATAADHRGALLIADNAISAVALG